MYRDFYCDQMSFLIASMVVPISNSHSSDSKKTKSFQSHISPYGGNDLCFFSPQSDTSMDMTMDMGLVHCVVHLFIAGSHCTYPWRDG